ncbi:MAG TPA: 6-carboxytetrahydropterin synthase [Fontimonas sp.]
MTTLFVDQLTVIDCAFLDVGRGLVGESWIVDIELDGELDAQSMVLDFGEVKRQLKRAIDGSADHALLVPRLAPELQVLEDGDELHLVFNADIGAIEHRSPQVAVCLIDAAEIDAGTVAAWLQPRLQALLPPSVTALRLRLRHERIDGAFYHYVHGLKKHRGACQRIAHGHRSRIEIEVDGARDGDLELQVARRWLDIYLGSREDIVARGNGRICFAYTAPEGHYQLALPETHVDLLDSDSTVECIAEHLARELSAERSGKVRVRAFEGVMKGAVAWGSARN